MYSPIWRCRATLHWDLQQEPLPVESIPACNVTECRRNDVLGVLRKPTKVSQRLLSKLIEYGLTVSVGWVPAAVLFRFYP
jgi:hypothetical protein